MNRIHLLLIIFLTHFSFSSSANAFNWHDLWVTKDQQALTMMNQGQFKAAHDTFISDDWRAAAAYRAKDYEQAAKHYQLLQQEDARYNQGNALAYLGKYKEAISAYNKTLAINPHHQDALYNRKIVEKLLKEQEDQKQQDQKQQDQKQQDQQQQDQQQQDQQQQDQKQQDQKQQDQKQQDQQQQDQKQQDQQQQDQKKQDQKQQNQKDQPQQDQDQQEQKQQKNPTPSEAETREKERAKAQWLNLIPDDPGGLLREKFLRDHLRRQSMWNP